MYFPIFKNRMYENKVLRENSYLFKYKSITPIIEVISVKTDIPSIIKEYDNYLDDKYFLDFFTFEHGEFLHFTIKHVKFALAIQNEDTYNYLDLLLETTASTKAIPVLSIKKARSFILNHAKLEHYITVLQSKKESIAIRLEGKYFDEYFPLIRKKLRKTDFFMFDIGNNNIDSFILQLYDFKEADVEFTSILLNSPRSEKFNNGDYENEEYTSLINNLVATVYKDYSFSGFGDYLGLKNELPSDGGRGLGCALILMYDYNKNKFFSIVNASVEDGLLGYRKILPKLLSYKYMLDPENNCLAYKYIDKHIGPKYGKYGNWATWKYILMLRTLSEMKKVYK
ncbi:MAG: hypothetical protein ACOX56_06860 [Acholeplasmataceae bacterium]